MMNDEHFMRMALRLARKGRPSPNPRVGAVLVRDGSVLATGYHRAAGKPHAEVDALARVGGRAPGATLYVTLEPCVHHGRTPPCAEAIVASGVARVVAGMVDPNPRVHGRGLAMLRRAGIDVQVGVLEAACQELNRGFVKMMEQGLPHVTLKLAATADGKIATRSGEARWITSEEARRLSHRLRAESDAVLVGAGTVVADDPRLTARRGDRPLRRQPLRVVLDSVLRSPLEARIFNDSEAATLVITTDRALETDRQALQDRGVEVAIVAADATGRVSLREALTFLARRGILYVVVEAGGTLAWSLVRAGLVDRYWFFHAPKLFGGASAPGMMGGDGVLHPEDAVRLRWTRVRRVGEDLLIEAEPCRGAETTSGGGA